MLREACIFGDSTTTSIDCLLKLTLRCYGILCMGMSMGSAISNAISLSMGATLVVSILLMLTSL